MSKVDEIASGGMGEKERMFFNILENIFIGANIEGKSGFINLMRIKSSYFRSFLSILRKVVEETLEEFPEFREELFDKLYNFFKRYFSESGSIHFVFTPLQENVWARVYTDKDVALFWKTRDLYYVKTDRIYKSMSVEVDAFKFFFDASEVEHRKAYEKRKIIYELKDVSDDGTIHFQVIYSERGRETKIEEILRRLKDRRITEEVLEKAFKIFERQSEVDYFINKDANAFLKEQFEIWLRHYIMDEESEFSEKRLKELKALKTIAFKIIDFISQFEDELRKIWEKPKFVLNSEYVITLDRIKELCGEDFLENYVIPKVLANEEQLREWRELLGVEIRGISDLIETNSLQGKEWKKLPIDTKYFDHEFKWKLIEKISENNELDKVLDGWLIKSENWQALNTILPKFRGKVQTIYIDPPFNKEQDADYYYHVKYKDSTWITMLENRLQLARHILKDTGSIFVRCDDNGNMYVRLLMNEIFGEENFQNEIVIKTSGIQKEAKRKFLDATESLFFYAKNKEQCLFYELYEERETDWQPFVHYPGVRNQDRNWREVFGIKLYPPLGRHWGIKQDLIDKYISKKLIRFRCKICGYEHYEGLWDKCPKCGENDFVPEIKNPPKKVDSNWTNIQSYSQDPDFPTRNAEQLIQRVFEATSKEGDLVMDFFLGSGTATAVAHKLRRKWIGVEMGEHFWTIVLPRMKKVLAGEKSGISRNINWEGSGFFKYYELEQYEQTLDRAVYKDTHPFVDWTSSEIYSHYVFLKDEKMLRALEIDYNNKTVKVDLSKLYPNIDIAETISNLKGKWIKRLTRKEVEFEDGEVIDLGNLDWKLIKPLIWW
jgi:adenine specific DNA methylase Mod